MMFIIILLPLLPILLAFIKGRYDIAPMHYLVLVCLLDLMKGLSDHLTLLGAGHQYIIQNIITLLQWIALIQLFKTGMDRPARIVLNIFVVAFLSSMLTWFFVAGWERHGPVIDTLQSLLLIVAILTGIFTLVRDRMLQIFHSPLLYIAAGSLFYILLSLLMEWAGPCCQPGKEYPGGENRIFLSIATVVKYALYVKAVLVCFPPGQEPAQESADT